PHPAWRPPPARPLPHGTVFCTGPDFRLSHSRSILRGEVFEVVLGQAASKTFLAQHVTDGLRVALLEFPDFLLYGYGSDEPIGVYGAGLVDARGAVEDLRFGGRVAA